MPRMTAALFSIYRGNAFKRRVASRSVPGLQAADAVGNGTVEMCHTASYYYVGKDPTFSLFTAQPFGLNARMQTAWMEFGGALDLANAFYKKYGFLAFPAGNTGTQMGGWFRKEIKSVDDLKGLKFRTARFNGQVFSKMAPCRSRSPAVTSIGAGEGHDRRSRVGRSV